MTIRDIAKRAEVSVATVSRVLNGQPGYSEATRQRVLSIVEQTRFSRNELARGLTGKGTQSIGVLLPTLTGYFQSEILAGIETAAHTRDLSVIICNTDQNGSRTSKYLQTLWEKRVDGIIFVSEWLTPEYKDALEAIQAPVVLVSTFSPYFPFRYVKVDDKWAAFDAVSFLIQHGHSDIGMISGSQDDLVAGHPRLEGYKEALRTHGIPIDRELIAYGHFDFRTGKAAMHSLLDAERTMSAVFATSDEMALGAMAAAYERGYRIPEDISIMGYDDTLLAEMTRPALTAVRQPINRLGELGIEVLVDPPETETTGIIMPHSITERESVRSI